MYGFEVLKYWINVDYICIKLFFLGVYCCDSFINVKIKVLNFGFRVFYF